MNKEELEKLIDFLDLRITMRKVDKSNLNYEENQLIKLCITCSDLLKENQKYKEVIEKLKKHCEIEINASNHYLENHSSQKELCHKVAHQRILDIIKEVEE